MKKWIALLLSALLAFTVLVTALAENQLRFFYDATTRLLFETSNVTLTGHAEFSLDGKRFKPLISTIFRITPTHITS